MQTSELLAKVRKIEIQTKHIVDEITGGAYHSVFKGRGLEFSEVREYTPGDDVRDIDWNVTARMGQPFIKKYAEERELNVMLAVDISSSTLFGSSAKENKRSLMIQSAALLALSAIRNNDKVGLFLFSDQTELLLSPRSGRTHTLRLIRELLASESSCGRTDLGIALETLASFLKKKTVIFLISDFMDGKDYEKQLRLLARKHDLIAMRILDPAEKILPCEIRGMTLEDLESGETLFFTGSREQYALGAEQQSAAAAEICRKANVDMIEICSGEDPVKALMTFFRKRRSGKRK
ncbi:MAG: DUF58 domain-containing protein [Lentisphaeria bacterium]|nr:DUF58 domain-containing protein [Lentisphaeria bacterium]